MSRRRLGSVLAVALAIGVMSAVEHHRIESLVEGSRYATLKATFATQGLSFDKHPSVGILQSMGGSIVSASGRFSFLSEEPTVEAEFLPIPQIDPAQLRKLDVLLVPGGSGRSTALALGEPGRDAIRQFVQEGGGYIGICGGAFLATASYDWSLALLDVAALIRPLRSSDTGFKRSSETGDAIVNIELTDSGADFFDGLPRCVHIRYSGGPILSRARRSDLGSYVALATYRGETSFAREQHGKMRGTPAIVAGNFGRGVVVLFSPHPESTPGLESMILSAIRLASRRREVGVIR